MTNFNFQKLNINDAYLIQNFYADDERGWFSKNFVKELYKKNGIEFNLNETFISKSKKNVIRGMHFQINAPQSKLVSVIKGRVYDVIIDLRKNSSTYMQYAGFELSDNNHNALFVPRGFAHGFLALDEENIMLYQCDGEYDKNTDTGIRFDDKDINIKWPIKNISEIIISDKDSKLMSFKEFDSMKNVEF